MIQRVLQHPLVKGEGKKLVRFVLVGGTSFLIYFFGYLFLSRTIFPGVNPTLLNLAAIGFSVTFNFLAHRKWTYEVKEKSAHQVMRYLLVVFMASAIQGGVFYIGFEWLHIHDLLVSIAAAGTSAVFSFLAHRWFTFHTKSPSILPAEQ